MLQVIVQLLARGGHRHIRTAAAATMAQLIVSRHSRRFLDKLPVIDAIMKAWEFRDPPPGTPDPNPKDPKPHFALEEMLATLLACVAQSAAGRQHALEPTSLAVSIHFMSLPTVTARDVCVTTMASLVRAGRAHMPPCGSVASQEAPSRPGLDLCLLMCVLPSPLSLLPSPPPFTLCFR